MAFGGIPPRPPSGFLAIFSWEFQRFLEKLFPKGLYGRSLWIVVAPVVFLQVSVGYLFIEKYYEEVTKSLSSAYVREIAHTLTLYKDTPTPNPQAFVARMNADLDLGLQILDQSSIPDQRDPLFSSVFLKIRRYLSQHISSPFWIGFGPFDTLIEIQILVKPQVVFQFRVPFERVHASTRPLFLIWMVGSSFLFLSVALLFLRHQINPILRLTKAAQAFGMGRDVPDFKPGGAQEIQAASLAFLEMKKRIERQVEQRTLLLAGVSHDLKTVLTRLNLELALLPRGPTVENMREDARQMQQILEHYLEFASQGTEEAAHMLSVPDLVEECLKEAERFGGEITLSPLPSLPKIALKPLAFKRCLGNLLHNALKYASKVVVSVWIEGEKLFISVEDDGPGIPQAARDQVFEPFFRLESARTLDASSVGLGLTIARDIARAHGGDLTLGQSAMGGLRAVIVVEQRSPILSMK